MSENTTTTFNLPTLYSDIAIRRLCVELHKLGGCDAQDPESHAWDETVDAAYEHTLESIKLDWNEDPIEGAWLTTLFAHVADWLESNKDKQGRWLDEHGNTMGEQYLRLWFAGQMFEQPEAYARDQTEADEYRDHARIEHEYKLWRDQRILDGSIKPDAKGMADRLVIRLADGLANGPRPVATEYVDYMKAHLAAAIDVTMHGGTLLDLDCIAALGTALFDGNDPGWAIYHKLNGAYDGDLLDLCQTPEQAQATLLPILANL